MRAFSFNRFAALLRKEWLQMKRGPITLRFIIALPMMQLLLFGYAINTDPKNLPAGLLSVEHSKYERTIITALRNTGYYKISMLSSEAEAERGLARGELLFVINIPPNFDRSIDRGETPSILVDADASDPTAIANATAALPALSAILNRDLPPVNQNETSPTPFQFVVHARYNPEQLTVLNIVPGLICVVLIFSTVFVTAFSITRERSAARWRICSPCQCGRSRLCSPRSCLTFSSVTSRWRSSSLFPSFSFSCQSEARFRSSSSP
jgi:ABC-2 type transport system permease protein